jgi:hypothetical protein
MERRRLSVNAVICQDTELLTSVATRIEDLQGLDVDHGVSTANAESYQFDPFEVENDAIEHVMFSDVRIEARVVRDWALVQGEWTMTPKWDWQRDLRKMHVWLYADDLVIGISREEMEYGTAAI